MRTLHLAALALVTTLAACASTPDSGTVGDLGIDTSTIEPQNGPQPGPHGQPEPGEGPMLGVHHARPSGGGGTPGNMTLHGGEVMSSSFIKAIFWGASWSNATFVGDKITGLDTLYGGLSGTAYADSNAEYGGINGTHVTNQSTYGGHLVDTSAAPSRAPKTSAILAEVCKMITSPVANGYYPVYTDTKRGSAGYCAWHSYGTCSGVPVQFGFFFNLDGDTGCDPADTTTGHSQGLAALASVTGHEFSEAVTDPRNGGWYDSAGSENADKCAWSFPPTNVQLGGQAWKIQGNWSNAAFTAGTGYANRDGQRGCLPAN
ncbi:MAG TPA: hypothetical protein VLT33_52070 [Labilithrix sp.]|nr:hypothetical protein [Labilithrix sp.]